MHNVFIAIGGSGTKVADMLVRLLAIGFPTGLQNTTPTSAGDSLEIWCVDPDRSSAALAALKKTISDYVELQTLLVDPKTTSEQGSSSWSMSIDPVVRYLDPLQLGPSNSQSKTLSGILDSGDANKKSTGSLLRVFYEEKDLNVTVDRGFYQKPFIGAPIMAIFADTLKNENSTGGREIHLRTLQNKPVRFMLAGSLHGGTGACGVPVMARFLSEFRQSSQNLNWTIGGCLMAPYAFPPDPPFSKAAENEAVTEQLIDSRLASAATEEAFRGLNPEEKRQLARQILEGFYADPDEMNERARHTLMYYDDHGASYFDELYLVGKPEPDRLKVWSNGGRNQKNPYNVAETVGAVSVLNFFAHEKAAGAVEKNYNVPSSHERASPNKFRLQDLPLYSVATLKVDPERVLLATALLRHLVLHAVPWPLDVERWSGIDRLKSLYPNNAAKNHDHARFTEAMRIITGFADDLLNADVTLGWSEEDLRQLRPLFADDEASVAATEAKLRRQGLFGLQPRAAVTLGNTAMKLTATEFGRWAPVEAGFTRGAYLRCVWANAYLRGGDAKVASA